MTPNKAIEIMQELWRYEHTDRFTDEEVRTALLLAIGALESVKRPQGEWVHIHTDFTKYHYKCSICDRQINSHGKLSDYPFCHCGADMRVKDELKEEKDNE